MICKVCSIDFLPNHRTQLCCSENCVDKNTKRIKREYYERNTQLVKDRSTKFRISNPEKYKESSKKNRDKEENKAKMRILQKSYHLKNKDKISEYGKIYNNTPERKAYMKEYRKPEERRIKERASGVRWGKRNPDIEKKGHLRRTFGITLEKYNEMLKDQNNSCWICKNPETCLIPKTDRPRDLSVDHCHTTGKVRGLLCFNCNSAIGRFKDSIETLQSAIDYLKKHGETDGNS